MPCIAISASELARPEQKVSAEELDALCLSAIARFSRRAKAKQRAAAFRAFANLTTHTD
jgi:hypothetical protein